MYVPKTPAELCGLLNLGPTPAQEALMTRLARAHGVQDVQARIKSDDDFDGDALRAAMMVVLWRTLTVPGARATVVAPSVEGQVTCGSLGTTAMGFLSEVCATRDVVLASMTSIRDWNRVRFSGEEGWEVHLVPNVRVIAEEAALRSLVGLVIHAGHAETRFVEASKALEAVGSDPRGLVIRLW